MCLTKHLRGSILFFLEQLLQLHVYLKRTKKAKNPAFFPIKTTVLRVCYTFKYYVTPEMRPIPQGPCLPGGHLKLVRVYKHISSFQESTRSWALFRLRLRMVRPWFGPAVALSWPSSRTPLRTWKTRYLKCWRELDQKWHQWYNASWLRAPPGTHMDQWLPGRKKSAFVTSDAEKMFFMGAVTLLYLFEVEKVTK